MCHTFKQQSSSFHGVKLCVVQRCKCFFLYGAMVNDTISIIREQVHSNLNIRRIYIFVHNKSSVQCLMYQEQQRAVVPLTTRAIAKLLQFCLLSVYVQQRKNKYIYPSEDICKKKNSNRVLWQLIIQCV